MNQRQATSQRIALSSSCKACQQGFLICAVPWTQRHLSGPKRMSSSKSTPPDPALSPFALLSPCKASSKPRDCTRLPSHFHSPHLALIRVLYYRSCVVKRVQSCLRTLASATIGQFDAGACLRTSFLGQRQPTCNHTGVLCSLFAPCSLVQQLERAARSRAPAVACRRPTRLMTGCCLSSSLAPAPCSGFTTCSGLRVAPFAQNL